MHAHSLTVGPYITLNGYTGIIRHVIVIEYTFTHYLIYDACLSSQNSLSSDLHFKSSFQTIRHIIGFPPIFYTIQFHSSEVCTIIVTRKQMINFWRLSEEEEDYQCASFYISR